MIPTTNRSWSLKEQQLLMNEETVFQVVSLKNGRAVLQDTLTKEKRLIEEHALLEAIQSGVVTELEREIDSYESLSENTKNELRQRNVSSAAMRVAIAKSRWIKEINKKGIDRIKDTARVRLAIEELKKHEMLGQPVFKISTLEKVQRTLRANSGSVISLVPKYEERGGRGKSRLDKKVEAVIEVELDRERDKTGNITLKEIVENVQHQVKALNAGKSIDLIGIPSESTIIRRIKTRISDYDLYVRKHGKKAANRAFRESGERVTAAHPLDVIEYDDVDLNVFAVDSRTGLPLGRAYLTSGIDQYSGVLMGYDFGHQHRSTQSAVNAILDGMLPKDTSLSKYSDLKHPWIGYGTAGVNLLDNALYNHAQETLRIQMEVLNVAGWSRPHQPTDKSSIENFNKIVQNDFAARLDGWVGTDDNRFGTSRGLEGAIYSIQELERKFIEWVTGVYTNRQTVNGTTPRELWRRYYQDRGPVVTWSREGINLLKMTPNTKQIRDGGVILVAGLRYSCDELQQIKKTSGVSAKLEIFESSDQLEYILVKHPHTGVLFKVGCIEDPRYIKDLKRRQQNLILSKARNKGYRHPDFSKMVEARNELRDETDKGRLDKKLSRRKLAVNNATPDFKLEKNTETKIKEVEVLITDLEMRIHDLDKIEINFDEDWL
jgi:putative transposase